MKMTASVARSTIWHMVFVACCFILAAGNVRAQENYPSRPIILTHGFSAGGNADVISRIIAAALSPRLGRLPLCSPGSLPPAE